MVSQIPWAHLKTGGGPLSRHKPEYRGKNNSYQSLFDQTTEKDRASPWGSLKSAHHNLQKRTPVKRSFPIFSLLEEHDKRKRRTKGQNLRFLFFFAFASLWDIYKMIRHRKTGANFQIWMPQTAIPTQNMESQQSFLASFRDLVSCWKLSKWTDVRILLHGPDTEITTLDCKFKSNEIVQQMLSGLGGSPCSHWRLVQTGTTYQARVIKANFLKKNYIQYYQIPTSVQFSNLPFKGKKELRKDSW